jgi:methylglutaconyl-CoA hydratase
VTGPSASVSPLQAGRVQLTVADGVGRVTFGHPRSNSLPGALLAQLAETIGEAGRREDIRVILLESEGTGAFCAGASFDELKAIENGAEGKQFFSGFAKVILAMIRAPKFVVTRVHGKAAGGGVGLIAASDYALATAAASVKLSELAIGIGPFVVGPVIEKKIGLGAYQAMSVDADWRSAEWGANAGLYAALAGDVAALDTLVASRSAWWAGMNPAAMKQLKAVCWEGTEEWDALLAKRAEMSGTLVLTEPARAAIHKT